MNFQDFKAKLCQLTRRKQEHYKQSQRGGRTGGDVTWGMLGSSSPLIETSPKNKNGVYAKQPLEA